MYKCGAIVLVPFPFTDLSSQKLRPALIISRNAAKNDDIVVLFITSKTEHATIRCYRLSSSQKDFVKTGLKVDSLIRCDKIATLSKKIILGEIGFLSKPLLKKVSKIFCRVFGF